MLSQNKVLVRIPAHDHRLSHRRHPSSAVPKNFEPCVAYIFFVIVQREIYTLLSHYVNCIRRMKYGTRFKQTDIDAQAPKPSNSQQLFPHDFMGISNISSSITIDQITTPNREIQRKTDRWIIRGETNRQNHKNSKFGHQMLNHLDFGQFKCLTKYLFSKREKCIWECFVFVIFSFSLFFLKQEKI